MKTLLCLLRCTRATAAVEAAIFAPIFMLFTLGVSDLGAGLYVRMQVNAATQSGAIYAVVNSGAGATCETMTSTCLSAVKAVINDATGNELFCSTYTCRAEVVTPCPPPDDNPPNPQTTKCITVEANYPYTPILPEVVYSWAQTMTVTSTSIIRAL